ncbi:MAG: hypothetical protein V5A79_07965 [Candidatus Bipolaricaulota bacterium]
MNNNWKSLRPFTLILIIFVAFIFLSGAEAKGVEYLSDELSCVKLSGQFMKSIVEGDVDEAFDFVDPYFPISQHEFDNLVQQTRVQLQGSQPNFGSMLNYKFVREERVEDFLLRFTFVIKHELTVTVWKFLYYRPEDKWLLNSLNWNDQVSDLFSPD